MKRSNGFPQTSIRRLTRTLGWLSFSLLALSLSISGNLWADPAEPTAEATPPADAAAAPDEPAPVETAPPPTAPNEPAPAEAAEPPDIIAELDSEEAPPVEPSPPADEPKAVESPTAEPKAKPLGPAARAQAGKSLGAVIRVPLPITGSVDTQVKRTIGRALAKMASSPGRPVLILEFTPSPGKDGAGSDFGRALGLAQFLSSRELSGAKTVAYLPRSIKGHGVLVAMACEEIVMAPDAEIGDAGADLGPEEAIDPTVRSGYRQIANLRRTIPSEVALGMLDKDLEVLKVETEVATEYVLRADLDALQQKHNVQSEKVVIRAGERGHFAGREARELGFVKFLATDRASVAKALSLAPEAALEDPSITEDWRPVRIPIKGAITAALVERVQRSIEQQIRDQDANFVCLWIDSPGGAPNDSMRLANYLASLDPGKVRTVAYVPNEARSDAALIAVACDQIVMHPAAILGGSGAANLEPDEIMLLQTMIKDELAGKKGKSWSLPVAMIDPRLQVFRFTSKDNGGVEYLSLEEVGAKNDANRWERGEEVTSVGEPLRLRGQRAEELGVARQVVHDFNEFKHAFGLENELALIEPSWADFLIDALASPGVQWLLLLIGGAALYAELQAPGIGFGGFVSGLCFMLWFWSKHLNGTAGWLEALLFLAGVCCVLLEVFVLPGVGIFALGGGLMIVLSLVLASQTFIVPHNDYQMEQLRNSLLGLVGAGAGVVVAALILRRYLPHTPLLSHMMLEPPTGEELESISHRESMVDLEHLVGHRGHTTTPLVPSGKARFGNELVDVIADGEFVPRGSEVEVMSVRGNRVVVRSVIS